MAEVKQVKKVACEVVSRVVGYLRPIQNWNAAKRLEFYERKTYSMRKVGRADDNNADPHG
jgi:hypothetical protein